MADTPLILLDRDGVINADSDAFIKSPEEFHPLPGSLEAIARLKRAGWHIWVCTNQSGVARGLFDLATLAAIHARLAHLLAAHDATLDGLLYCPHGPDDHCDCRKPRPGLFEQVAAATGHNLTHVPAVGDSLRDLQAARAVGARPILVRTGKGERTLAAGTGLDGVAIYPDLAAVADALLKENAPC